MFPCVNDLEKTPCEDLGEESLGKYRTGAKALEGAPARQI